MSLDWQKVHVALAKGVQQAADERALEHPHLAVCKNASFTELGGIQKRHSFSSLGSLPGSSAPIRRLAVLNDELIAFTSDKVYSWSPTASAWKELADYEAVSVTQEAVLTRREEQDGCDQATLGGVRVICWRQDLSSGNVWLAAFDATSGTLLAGPYEETGGTSRPTLIAMNSRILFTVVDSTTELKYKMLLPSNIDSATANEGLRGPLTSIDADLRSGQYAVARHPTNDTYVTASSVDATSEVRLRAWTAGASGSPTADNDIDHLLSPSIQAMDINADGDIVLTRGAVADIFNSDLTAASTGNSLGFPTRSGGYTVQASTVAWEAAADGGTWTAHVFAYTFLNDYVVDRCVDHNTIADDGTTGTASEVHNRLNLASKAFAYGDDVYVWVLFNQANSATDNQGSLASGFKASLQNTIFLIRASDYMPVAKALFQNAAAYDSQSLPTPQATATGEYTILGRERRRISLGEQGSTGYEESSPVLVRAAFDSDDARRSVQLGETLYITGGQLMQLASGQLAEVGFDVYPWDLGVALSAGALTGTFVYKIYWRWNNGAGEVERSTTATFVERTLSSQDGDVRFNEFLTTRKAPAYGNAYPAVEIWRTQNNPVVGAPFYMVTSPDPSSADYVVMDGTGKRLAALNDDETDANLIKNQADPLEGQLEPIAPEGCSVVVVFGERLAIAGLPGKPNTVAYSKLRETGEIASFSDFLSVDVPAESGDITGLGVLNETLVAFCETGIYMLPGSGFDNAGGGQNYGPARLISNDVGCESQDALAVLPDGILFKSQKGWHMLDRSWSVNYIGAPVEDYDHETVNGITLMPDKHEVRIATSGRMLVWNTRANAWSEWDFTGGVTSTVLWRGQHVIATNSGTSILVDDEDYSNVDYALDLETAWIKLDGLQGFSRVRFLRVLGEYRSAGRLRIRVARDYRKSGGDWAWDDDKDWTISAAEAGDALRVRHRPSKQRCSAIKVRLTDKATGGGVPSGEILKLTGLSLEYGVKNGLGQLPESNKQ